MGKRKQKDFQKTKLRVGRKLPKGTNVTDTSFKSKQIITRDQQLGAVEEKPLNVLLKILDTKNSAVKKDTLLKIRNYITNHEDTLALYFTDILSKLGKVLTESDPLVTSCAVDVIGDCIKRLSDLQYKSFSASMMLHLSCMMSHGAFRVKSKSLKLLDVLLEAHPRIMSECPKVLHNLLNMVSTFSKATRTRKLDEIICSSVTSLQWRLHVFLRMRTFLAIADQEEDKDVVEDEKEIFWDGETRLEMVLYKDSGIKHKELDYSWYSPAKAPDNSNYKEFVLDLMHMLLEALKAELPQIPKSKQFASDVILSPRTIVYLNTIVNILWHLGEWVDKNLKFKDNMDHEILKQFRILSSLLMKSGFPYSQHNVIVEDEPDIQAQTTECMQLNLGLCYLYCMYGPNDNDSTSATLETLVFRCLKNVLCAVSEICNDSLRLLLKISKLVMSIKSVELMHKNAMLVGIYQLLEFHKLSKHYKMLLSFLMELSLSFDNQDLLSTDGMQCWFRSIFGELAFMMDTNRVDKNYLKYVEQVCVRKYPVFMDVLNNVNHEDLLKLLKYNHEDFQKTAIYLIMALDNIPNSFFEAVTDLICGDAPLPEKISLRFINLLNCRFSNSSSEKEKVIFVKFLLNTACDTLSLRNPEPDLNELDFFGPLTHHLSSTKYQIYPTTKWKQHQNVFETCQECLLSYLDSDVSVIAFLKFSKLVLKQETMPVHVVLALLHIRNKIGYLFEDPGLVAMCYHLMFSAFMYISIMTSEASREEVEMYSINDLCSCLLNLEQMDLAHMFNFNGDTVHEFTEGEYQHFFRIVLTLARRKKFHVNYEPLQNLLKFMAQQSVQSRTLPLIWRDICCELQLL